MNTLWLLPFLFSLFSQTTLAEPRFVVTIAPLSDIMTQLTQGRASVNTLLPPGASPHTYAPKPSDARMLSSATALFYVDANLDGFARKLPCERQISLFELVPESNRLRFDHPESKDEHPKGHDEQGHDEKEKRHGSHQEPEHHHDGDDPHFWTDPLTVKSMLPALVTQLCALDADGCVTYRANEAKLAQRLEALHTRLNEITAPYRGAAIMQDHPFFNYFLKRYGFTDGGTVEESTAKEPTPKSLKKTMDRAVKNKVRLLLTHPQMNDRAARLVGESAGIPAVQLDPLGKSLDKGLYETLLLTNAKQITDALGNANDAR